MEMENVNSRDTDRENGLEGRIFVDEPFFRAFAGVTLRLDIHVDRATTVSGVALKANERVS